MDYVIQYFMRATNPNFQNEIQFTKRETPY